MEKVEKIDRSKTAMKFQQADLVHNLAARESITKGECGPRTGKVGNP
jgi:hypothetical protein